MNSSGFASMLVKSVNNYTGPKIKNYYICELRVFGAMKRMIITLLAFVLSSFTLSRTGGISLAVIFVKHSYENTFCLPRQHMPQPYGGVCS